MKLPLLILTVLLTLCALAFGDEIPEWEISTDLSFHGEASILLCADTSISYTVLTNKIKRANPWRASLKNFDVIEINYNPVPKTPLTNSASVKNLLLVATNITVRDATPIVARGIPVNPCEPQTYAVK